MVSGVFIAEEIHMCMITSARTACSHPCRSVVKLNNNSTIKIPFRLELEFFTGEVNNQLGGQRMKTVFTRCLLQCYSVTMLQCYTFRHRWYQHVTLTVSHVFCICFVYRCVVPYWLSNIDFYRGELRAGHHSSKYQIFQKFEVISRN